MLTRSDVRALTLVFGGSCTRGAVAKGLGVSVNRVSYLLRRLECLDFIEVSKQNRRLVVCPGKTYHARLFKRLLILEPGTKYEEFLFGLNFRLLAFCLYSWKPVGVVAEALGISEKSVLNRSVYLRNRLLLVKQKKMVRFNSRTWPELCEFLSACRNYSKRFNNVLWQFEDETVFEAAKQDVEGVLTGFSAYPSHKVPMYVIKHACYLPVRRLSKEEVFIHSLLQIREETRLLQLAVVFMHKNELSRRKLTWLAFKYDCAGLLTDFFKVLEAKGGEVRTDTLPPVSWQGIAEMLRNYGVKA